MPKFDLKSDIARNTVHSIVDRLAGTMQFHMQSITGKPVFLVKNTPVLNTALDLAFDSVGYHGIGDEVISNEKKFAHLCFWMLKLSPVGYTINSLNLLPGHVWASKKPISVPLEFGHISVNSLISYYTFCTLYCTNMSKTGDHSDIEKNCAKMIRNKHSEEVVRSISFHNYSARSMAMFLEALTMDRLP